MTILHTHILEFSLGNTQFRCAKSPNVTIACALEFLHKTFFWSFLREIRTSDVHFGQEGCAFRVICFPLSSVGVCFPWEKHNPLVQ